MRLSLTRTLVDRARRALVDAVYIARRDRRINPEGDFDKAGRWTPSDRENAGGSGTSTRAPSRSWPFSYMTRCRTKEHATILIRRALGFHDVPPDVEAVLVRAGELIAATIKSDDPGARAEIVAAILTVLEARVELPVARRAPVEAEGVQ